MSGGDSPESGHHVRFSAFVTSSPSPSSPHQQQSLTTGLKLSSDEAVSALCSQAGYSKEEAAAVIRQAKERRVAEKHELRQARIELRTMITANGDLLRQVEHLKDINASLVQETRSLKRTIKDLRGKEPPEKTTKQQRGRRRMPLVE